MVITGCLPGFKPKFRRKTVRKLNFSAENCRFWADFGPILGHFRGQKWAFSVIFRPKIAKKLKNFGGFQFRAPEIENSNHLAYFNDTTTSIHAGTPACTKICVLKICPKLAKNCLKLAISRQKWPIWYTGKLPNIHHILVVFRGKIEFSDGFSAELGLKLR